MPVLLRLQGVWRKIETQARRLLRVLLLWLGPVSADAGRELLLRGLSASQTLANGRRRRVKSDWPQPALATPKQKNEPRRAARRHPKKSPAPGRAGLMYRAMTGAEQARS